MRQPPRSGRASQNSIVWKDRSGSRDHTPTTLQNGSGKCKANTGVCSLMLISAASIPLALSLRKVKLGGPAPVAHRSGFWRTHNATQLARRRSKTSGDNGGFRGRA
jgi:hypothetical protein